MQIDRNYSWSNMSMSSVYEYSKNKINSMTRLLYYTLKEQLDRDKDTVSVFDAFYSRD